MTVAARVGESTRAERAESSRLSQALIAVGSRHETVEEQYGWPAIADRVPQGAELAERARHEEAGELEWLARLAETAPGDHRFGELLGCLIPATRDHLGFEEDLPWPRLRQALTPAEAEELGRKVTDGKKTPPDRPYPGHRNAAHR